MKIVSSYSKSIPIPLSGQEREERRLTGAEQEEAHVWKVVAATSDGSRFEHETIFLHRDDADSFAQNILASKDITLEKWAPISPIYGSRAYNLKHDF
jgi:hypothetical protein